VVYQHPELGFEIRPEPGWRLLDEQPDRAALALPGPDAARPAILTVLAEPLVAGVDAAAFANAVLAADPELRVRDRAAAELGGGCRASAPSASALCPVGRRRRWR
jgi:hypothetical protein